ncbi:uncharacterized protein LOC127253366 isoform X2 [Andrographis paniculata]|uniref:uncharacterized protein LOC127253366 isoform X2 n=1 Tax=Andrographis paniculata TaxID=175694 RepID=UPI0021E77C81|nr:uncharacterized protein LOC127253366 isoform X2 [Andrographis paniculata]
MQFLMTTCTLWDSVEGALMEGSKSAETDIIPSSLIVKHLAVAIEVGQSYNSMKDVLASSRASSPMRERASKSISAVKSLVLREKEDKLGSEFGTDEKVLSVISALFNAEGCFKGRNVSGLEEMQLKATSLLREIHGVPVESFVVKLSEAVGCFKTVQKMASFWLRVVSELRRLWYEGQYITGVPPDNIPDLNSCLLYQQLQVINCCISRKKRHSAAVEALESVTARDSSNAEGCTASDGALPRDPCFYARTKSGELVLRLGADRECKNLAMLETGEPIYAPVMQEPPLLTEDLIKETEEFVLRTGSVGAGCSQLLADMQAFKAANPGSILEDFVRWHSPPDWVENDSTDSVNTSSGGDPSVKGQLSQRMQKEGNLWRELWDTSKPVPAVKQAPLYDEDLSVEGILDFMEEMPPSDLFKQLFIALLGSGLVIADSILTSNPSLGNLFNECKNFIVTTCQGNTWIEKLDDICQVYETVEAMILNPDEVINITVRPEETTPTGELKNRFKKLTLIFGGKNKSSSKDSKTNNNNSNSGNMFSKKPPKAAAAASPSSAAVTAPSLVENDWTLV